MDKSTDSGVLVTGATGTLGSHVIIELLRSDIPLKVLVRNIATAQTALRRLFDFYALDFDQKLKLIHWIEGDICDFSLMDDTLSHVQSVFHCAGWVPSHNIKPNLLFRSHVEATTQLVNLSLFHGVKWFGHTSSVATLGPNTEGLVDEDYFWKPGKHHSYYSQVKYLAEQEVWRGKEEGLHVFIINPSVLVGPAMFNRGSFELFNKVTKGLPFFINGSSGYVDVRDSAAFFVQQWQKGVHGIRVICSAENLEQKEFLSRVALKLNKKPPSYRVGRSMFLLGSFLERLLLIKKKQLSSDLYKMASSRNAYDNTRSVELGAHYRSIEEAIENTARFINFQNRLPS
jgi:nucleoside-diphosphate-sugar epimerase